MQDAESYFDPEPSSKPSRVTLPDGHAGSYYISQSDAFYAARIAKQRAERLERQAQNPPPEDPQPVEPEVTEQARLLGS
jgi:hypothetical protein